MPLIHPASPYSTRDGKSSPNFYLFQANQAHYYNAMNVKPLKDSSLLPDALREKCTDKAIYWDERVSAEKGLSVRGKPDF